MGNFNLNLVCFVVRPVASNVPVGGEIVLLKCLPTLCTFALFFIAKLKFTSISVRIAIGAVDLDDRMVFY